MTTIVAKYPFKMNGTYRVRVQSLRSNGWAIGPAFTGTFLGRGSGVTRFWQDTADGGRMRTVRNGAIIVELAEVIY